MVVGDIQTWKHVDNGVYVCFFNVNSLGIAFPAISGWTSYIMSPEGVVEIEKADKEESLEISKAYYNNPDSNYENIHFKQLARVERGLMSGYVFLSGTHIYVPGSIGGIAIRGSAGVGLSFYYNTETQQVIRFDPLFTHTSIIKFAFDTIPNTLLELLAHEENKKQ